MIHFQNMSLFVRRLPIHHFAALLFMLTLLRNGISLYGERFRQFTSDRQPWFFDFSPTNDPFRRLFESLGFSVGPISFLFFYLGFIFCGTALISIEIRAYSSFRKKVFWTFIGLLPGTTIILSRFGTSDCISFIFAILSAVSKNSKRQYIYLSCLMLSHIESTLVISIVIAVVSCVGPFQTSFKRFFGSRRPYLTVMFMSLILTALNSQEEGSRVSQFFPLLKLSVAQALSAGVWLPYSWFGGTILVLLFALNRISKNEVVMLSSMVFCLGLFSLITADGTRVATLVLTLPLVSFFVYALENELLAPRYLVLGFLFPAINVSNLNVFLPFRQVAYLFGLDLTFISS